MGLSPFPVISVATASPQISSGRSSACWQSNHFIFTWHWKPHDLTTQHLPTSGASLLCLLCITDSSFLKQILQVFEVWGSIQIFLDSNQAFARGPPMDSLFSRLLTTSCWLSYSWDDSECCNTQFICRASGEWCWSCAAQLLWANAERWTMSLYFVFDYCNELTWILIHVHYQFGVELLLCVYSL